MKISTDEEGATADSTRLVDVGKALGIPISRGSDGGVLVQKDQLLEALISRPSPFVLELRRQHLAECLDFVARFQRALGNAGPARSRAGAGVPAVPESGRGDANANCFPMERQPSTPGQARTRPNTAFTDSGTIAEINSSGAVIELTPVKAAPLLSVRQAEAALASADKHLTEDQRCIYLLRGFGRRLPDGPNAKTEEPAKGGVMGKFGGLMKQKLKKAMQVTKVRRLLKERVSELTEENAAVSAVDFVKRLQASGTVRPARLWSPTVTVGDVVRSAGLLLVRPDTATGPLEEFLQKSAADDDEPSPDDQAQEGRDIWELSLGYPGFALHHFLSVG